MRKSHGKLLLCIKYKAANRDKKMRIMCSVAIEYDITRKKKRNESVQDFSLFSLESIVYLYFLLCCIYLADVFGRLCYKDRENRS